MEKVTGSALELLAVKRLCASTDYKYGLKTVSANQHDRKKEKGVFRCFPKLVKLILLHTVVVSHNTHNNYKHDMLGQRGGGS